MMDAKNLKRTGQRGMTLLELMVVVVVIGILGMAAVTRFLVAQDRAHVMAAVADADHFRKALAVYAVDYGAFPDNGGMTMNELSSTLIDPRGMDYMVLPNGETFADFAYVPVDNGETYALEIIARDNGTTGILATPDGTEIVG